MQVVELKDIDSGKEPVPKQKKITTSAARARTWTNKVRNRLHYRFPNLVLLQNRQKRAYVILKDKEDNLETRVPEAEELRQRALWGVEIFGPAEIEGLYSALKRLGWTEGLFANKHSNPSKWVAEQRMYGSSGSYNLGLIQNRGKKSSILWDRQAPIPDTVEYMHGYIHQVTPSITAVIICFVLRDKLSTEYEIALTTDRETKTVPNGRNTGYSMYGVEHLKISAVEEVRTRSKKIVSDWFEEYLPGLFSKAEDGNRLPTAELITCLREPLLPSVRDNSRKEPSWVTILRNHQFSTIWKYKHFEDLTFSWDTSDDGNRFHTLINLRTERVTDKHLENRGDNRAFAYVAFVSERVEGVLINFAVSAALQDAIRTLQITRDTLMTDSSNHKKVLIALKQIKNFFDKSIGLPIMTSELVNMSKTDRYYRWRCSEFLNDPWNEDEQTSEIAEVLRSNTHFLASRALAQEKETREHLEQISTILSTQENVRSQRRMEVVTYVAIFLATASLFVAVMSVDRFATVINHQVDQIFKIK